MSGIEIVLGVCVAVLVVCVAVLVVWNLFLTKSHGDVIEKVNSDSVKDDLHNVRKNFYKLRKEIKEQLGYFKTFDSICGNAYYYAPSKSVHERINLLMDHLNLEIKEGEPSKTTLVKKKAIKKGK